MGFSEFAMKHAREPRFKAIEKMKDREQLFNEFLQESKKKQDEEQRSKADKVWGRFCSMWPPRGPRISGLESDLFALVVSLNPLVALLKMMVVFLVAKLVS